MGRSPYPVGAVTLVDFNAKDLALLSIKPKSLYSGIKFPASSICRG